MYGTRLVTVSIFLLQTAAEKKEVCPNGQPPVNCIINPCEVKKCPAYPHAICRSNYCGGCNAEFYVHGQEVHCYCPNGKPPAVCRINPCSGTVCADFPTAYCRPNPCQGCRAEYYLNYKRVKCSLCPNGRPPANCLVDPCQVTKCPVFPNAECRSNYCGGCHAEFFVKDKRVSCAIKKEGTCPKLPPGTVGTCDERCTGDISCPGKQKCCSHGCGHSCQDPILEKPGKCPVSPPGLITICLVRCSGDFSCPGNQKCCPFGCMISCSPPAEKTKPGYCPKITPNLRGICVEKCKDDSDCPKQLKCCSVGCGHTCQKPALCPDGRPPVNCFVDPCQVTQCPAFPKAKCKSNYCGGCNAEFFVDGKQVNCTISQCKGKKSLRDSKGREVFCGRGPGRQDCPPGYRCNIHPADRFAVCCPIDCPDGKPPVQCLVNPCDVRQCLNHPNAECRPTYCGGCYAEYFIKNKRVKCSVCEDGSAPTRCKRNPCLHATCLAFVDAKCRPNYCGGCNAEFFIQDKKLNCRLCPNGKIPKPCLVNPCVFSHCPAYPHAQCRPNPCCDRYCGVEFVLNGKVVDCHADYD